MCGIWGIIAKKPRRFDYTTFCTLGIHNDIRGGDSCGVFIDGKVEYGTNKNKFFEDFLSESELVQETKEATIALGHDRKASVGVISEKTAQPVVLYDKEGKAEFVVLHNGTIYNYEKLANKYIPDIDIKGMTDSQVMTRIFYYKGYDVLSEYNGGSVFVIVDYRNGSPEVFFWQGESIVSLYGKIEKERPLYLAIAKDHITFSSIYTFLPVLERNAEIVELKSNCLFSYKNDNVEIVKEYPRDKQAQYNRSYYDMYGQYSNNYYTGQKSSNYTSNNIFGSTKDGICFRDGNPIHGMCRTTSYGICTGCGQMYEIWFFQGIVMNNKEGFDYLSKICRELGTSPSELYDIYPELVLYLSPYPYFRTIDGSVELVDTPISSSPFTGEFQFPFTSTKYIIKDGKTSSTCTTSQFEALSAYFKHKDDKLPIAELVKNFGDYE